VVLPRFRAARERSIKGDFALFPPVAVSGYYHAAMTDDELFKLTRERLTTLLDSCGADASSEEQRLTNEIITLAENIAAKRRQMVADMLALMMTQDAESVLTLEEMRYVMSEAVRQDWVKKNDDGTLSLTDAGRECVDNLSASQSSAHH
jgi:hypothetical protein